MAHARAEALVSVQRLLRQLREIKGVQERQPGIFYLRGAAFVHFHDDQGVLTADLKKAGGSGFDRYTLASAPAQRKLIDDAKRRASRGDDD